MTRVVDVEPNGQVGAVDFGDIVAREVRTGTHIAVHLPRDELPVVPADQYRMAGTIAIGCPGQNILARMREQAGNDIGSHVGEVDQMQERRVGPAVIERLLTLPATPVVLARVAYDNGPGHPVLIGRDHWQQIIAEASGDRGARGYLASIPLSWSDIGVVWWYAESGLEEAGVGSSVVGSGVGGGAHAGVPAGSG